MFSQNFSKKNIVFFYARECKDMRQKLFIVNEDERKVSESPVNIEHEKNVFSSKGTGKTNFVVVAREAREV